MGVFIASLFLLLLEVILRRIHFRFEPETEFAYPRPGDFSQLRYDPVVFWTLAPSQPGVNSWGFRGDEIVTPKPDGAYRILFLGDSIMQTGYPYLVEQCLHQTGFPNAETILLAVNGYSSYQGRVLAEKYGGILEPDLVVLQFGWNDHWLAYGKPDAEKVLLFPNSTKPLWLKAVERIHIYQGLVWISAWLTGQDVNRVTGAVRVPSEQYRENLTVIRQMFEAKNVPVVLVTAPSGLGLLGVPQQTITGGFALSAENAIQLHTQYNEIVREVAGNGWMVDLEKRYAELSKEDLAHLFQEDNIHPSNNGSQEIAQQVCALIQEILGDR